MLKIFLFLFFAIELYSFSQTLEHKIIDLNLKIHNKSLNSNVEKAYPAISAIKGDLIIKTFYPKSINKPFKFQNFKIYSSADYYELVVSYKGVNYFKKIETKEINNELSIDVYELGNKKNNIKIKELQYTIQNDEINKKIFITQDVLIKNNSNFVYSPLLPQKDFIKIQLPKGVRRIIPNTNLNKENYIIKDGFLILRVFLKPKNNYFSFSYIIDVDEYPFLVKTKSMNSIKKLTVLSVKNNTLIKSNIFSNFKIQELNNSLIKIAHKKNILKNKNINFTILSKKKLSNSFFISNISRYKIIKSIDKYFISISFIIFLFALIFILFSNKEKNV